MKKNVLFLMSGSIASYKACSVISKLVQSGHDVRVAATPKTFEFVGRATLEGLSGQPVFSDIFADGRQMDHIRLARWADMALLCPASSNMLNKLAAGIGDDAVSTLFLAWDFTKPFFVAPAMNHQMLKHPATQRSVKTLTLYGARILETGNGHQACGETGAGRMLEPDEIYHEVYQRIFSMPKTPEAHA